MAALRIAVPIGDPNGIGPEIAVKAALACARDGASRPLLVGDPFVIAHYAKQAGVAVGSLDIDPVDALPRSAFTPGTIAADAGRATVAYAERAIALAQAEQVGAIVACPHNETAVNAAGVRFSGYPSLIARVTGLPEERVFLMLIGAGMRIVHVTLHERLADALARLTPGLVEAAIRAAQAALGRLGVASPRLGVFGINPHAGENGLFGRDDDEITAPVVAKLRAEGVAIEGPQGADVMLTRDDFDAFVAIFHDQGHIPMKLLAGRSGAAMSIGPGFLFASVAHGSAFDIAGQDRGDPEAVLRAMALFALAPHEPIAS